MDILNTWNKGRVYFVGVCALVDTCMCPYMCSTVGPHYWASTSFPSPSFINIKDKPNCEVSEIVPSGKGLKCFGADKTNFDV